MLPTTTHQTDRIIIIILLTSFLLLQPTQLFKNIFNHYEWNQSSTRVARQMSVIHTRTCRPSAMIDSIFQQSWPLQQPQLLGLDGGAPPF